MHVVGAEEETEGRNAEVLREIALLLPEISAEVTLLGPGRPTKKNLARQKERERDFVLSRQAQDMSAIGN